MLSRLPFFVLRMLHRGRVGAFRGTADRKDRRYFEEGVVRATESEVVVSGTLSVGSRQ